MKIWTHVTTKALEGMRRVLQDTHDIFMYPVPYPRSDGRDGWTVVTRKK